ncbi:MAG TPA: FecCD family ABC transporter permease [Desulfobacterales bacterium]
MKSPDSISSRRLIASSAGLLVLLLGMGVLGLSYGSAGDRMNGLQTFFSALTDTATVEPMLETIIWRIRLPRVLTAALVGAVLALGGLVFQALLRNPLAEPYILGISGGSAIGAIVGILAGLGRFTGVSFTAFAGSTATLGLLLVLASGDSILKKDSLLLAGVMVNAFCGAVILFLISLTQDARLHNILFWMMGDLSAVALAQVLTLAVVALPCFGVLVLCAGKLNLMLMGRETAESLGVNTRHIMVLLLVTTSLMVSTTVSHCGLLGFVGLVIPHLLRMVLGPDHRILVPACILGGGAYLILCDLLSRVLPRQGEMPVGVITALVGAPLFIYLLKRTAK